MSYMENDGICGFVVTKTVYRKEFPNNPGTFCNMGGGLKIALFATSLPYVEVVLPVTAVKKHIFTHVSGVKVRDRFAEKIIEKSFPYDLNTKINLHLLEVLVNPCQKFYDVFLYKDFIPTAISVVDKLITSAKIFDLKNHDECRQYAQVWDTLSKVKYSLYHGVGCVERGTQTVWDDDPICLDD